MSLGTTVVPIIFAIRMMVVLIILAIRTTVMPIIFAIRTTVDKTMPGEEKIRTGTQILYFILGYKFSLSCE